MKPKEYCKKYRLDSEDPVGFSRKRIYEDLRSDFSDLLEVGKGRENIKGFENAMRALRVRFDSIVVRSLYSKRDTLMSVWDRLYSAEISPMRDRLFPEQMEARRKEREERARRKRDREEEERAKRHFYSGGESFFFFNNEFYQQFENLFAAMMGVPTSSPSDYAILGIEPHSSAEEVKSAFRKRALECHPDKGGDPDKFRKLVQARNNCLARA